MSGSKLAAKLGEMEPQWRDDAVTEHLREAWARAVEQWPEVEVSVDAVARSIDERLTPPRRSIEDLLGLELSGIYVACACAEGDSAAISAFERRFDDVIGVASRGATDAARTEFRQYLRHKLFVGEGAKIREYAGRGSLEGWVRVTARRAYLDLTRGIDRRRDEPAADGTLVERAAGQDLELDFLKRHYRREFGTAFAEALGGMELRARNVLRHNLVHRLSIDEIGALYDVHRATAARWITRARQSLLAGTRARMRSRLEIEEDELDSIMRLIDSRLEVSVVRVLGSKDEKPA